MIHNDPVDMVTIHFETSTKHQTIVLKTERWNHKSPRQMVQCQYDEILKGYWIDSILFIPREKIVSITVS